MKIDFQRWIDRLCLAMMVASVLLAALGLGTRFSGALGWMVAIGWRYLYFRSTESGDESGVFERDSKKFA